MVDRTVETRDKTEMRLKVVKVKGGGWAIEAAARIRGKWKVLGHEGGFASEAAASSELCRLIRQEALP